MISELIYILCMCVHSAQRELFVQSRSPVVERDFSSSTGHLWKKDTERKQRERRAKTGTYGTSRYHNYRTWIKRRRDLKFILETTAYRNPNLWTAFLV